MQKYIHYARKFINRPKFHGQGSLLAYLQENGWGELIINDCGRTVAISLNLTHEDPVPTRGELADAANTVFKLELLHREIGELKRAVKRRHLQMQRAAKR